MKKILAAILVSILLAVCIMLIGEDGSNAENTSYLYDNQNNPLAGGPINIPNGEGMDTSYYFKMNKDVPISEASLKISTMDSEHGLAPHNPYIDVGMDQNREWEFKGVGYSDFGEQRVFSDDSSKVSLSFDSSTHTNNDNDILIPEGAEILEADIGVRGRFQPINEIPITNHQIEKEPPTDIKIKPYAMESGDMDGDGDEDVVVSDTRADRLVWFENPNVTDADWELHVIYDGTDTTETYSIDVGDIDGDGDMDIAATSYTRGYVMWFRNNNNSASFTKFRFYSSFTNAGRVRIGDIDKDGNPDLVVSTWYYYHYSSYGDYLYWFEAPDDPGTNSSTSAYGSSSAWGYHRIANNPTYYYYVYGAMDLGDLNGDGYLDIALGMQPTYSWYNYKRVYTFTNPRTTGSWSTRSIDTSAGRPYSIDVKDMDNDGIDDIISAAYDENRIKIYRSANSGSSYSEYNVFSTTRPKTIRVEDLNGDDKLDIVVGGGSGIYEFSTLYQGSSYTSYSKNQVTASVVDPMAFSLLDIEKDGDIDFMVGGTSGSQLILVNTTSASIPSYKVSWLVDGGIEDIRGMDYVDMDGDEDTDIVFCAYQTGWVGWLENDGDLLSSPGEVHRIGTLGNAIEVKVGDVDGDDDIDVVGLSSGGVAIWWENIDDVENVWPGYLIGSGIPSAHALYVADLTGDGKADIATSSARGYSGGEIRIYKSPSDPRNKWPMNRIATSISYLARINGDDMDQDGDIDILAVAGAYGSGSVVYYENPLGMKDPMSGTWKSVSIGGGMYYPVDVATIDVTDDGYPDVVVTGRYYYYSKVRWFQSPYGDQVSSWVGRVIHNSQHNWRVTTGDIGNDGYADIIFNRGTYSSPSSIYWYEEGVDYTKDWTMRSIGGHSGTWALGIADLENDGVQEIISTSRSSDEIRSWNLDAKYPEEIGLDVGSDLSGSDWSFEEKLIGNVTVDIKDYLQFVIDNEPSPTIKSSDKWGTEMLSIPMELSSGTNGRVQMEDINIVYNATILVDEDGKGKPLSEALDRIIPDYIDDGEEKMRIYIGVGAESAGRAYLSDLYVEYNAIPRPSKAMEKIEIDEDKSAVLGFDLRDYFTDDYTDPEDLEIKVVLTGPKADKIKAEVTPDGRLALDASVTPNFYTRLTEPYDIYAVLHVTDKGGLNGVPPRTLITEPYPVIVRPVNDEPVLTGEQLPILYGIEGQTVEVVDLNDYTLFYDADNDKIQYEIMIPELDEIPNYNETANLKVSRIGNRIEVSLDDFSDWTGTIPLKVFGIDGKTLWSIHKTPYVETFIQINNTNDPPTWMDIPDATILEDEEVPRIMELTKYVHDIDTLNHDMIITINDWTNRSFVGVSLEYMSNGEVYLKSSPIIENWNGWVTISLRVDDGEFTHDTEMNLIIEPVNDLPSLKILEPSENGRIEPGFFSVVGEAYDVEGIEYVDVLFYGEWYRADGRSSWGKTLKAPALDSMTEGVPIQVRAFDGEEFVYENVNITILKYIIPQIKDTDSDGYFDNMDDFPNDPSEWIDSDRDGMGDNADQFPENSDWKYDTDEDGIADAADTNPNDPMLWNDNNRDGVNDDEPPRLNSGLTDGPKKANWTIPIIAFIIAGILLIMAILSFIALMIKASAAKDPKKMAKFHAFEMRMRDKQNALIEKGPFASMSDKVSDSMRTGAVPQPSATGGPAPVPSLGRGTSGGPQRPGLPPPQARTGQMQQPFRRPPNQ